MSTTNVTNKSAGNSAETESDEIASNEAGANTIQNLWPTIRRQTFMNALNTSFGILGDERFQQLTLAQANDLLKTIEVQFGRFENEHFALVCTPSQTQFVETHMQVYDQVNADYMKARQLLAEKVAEKTPLNPPPNVQTETQKVQVELRTPDALANMANTWGKFNGDFTEWHSFRDKWMSQIHGNENVMPVLKLQYLLASVVGKAAKTLGKWQLTDANYKNAWERLCNAYEDDYLAVQTLVRELLATPKMESRTYDGLRKIIDTVHGCINQLQGFVDVKNWDPITVFMVIDLMDPETHSHWENDREKNAQDSMEIDDTDGAVGGQIET